MTNELWTTSLNVSSQCEYLAVCQCLWEKLVDERWHCLKWTTMCWQGLKWLFFLVIPLRELWQQSQHLTRTLCAFTQAKTEYLHVFRKLLLSTMFEGSDDQQFKGNMFCLGAIDLLFSTLGAKRLALHSYAICDLEAFDAFWEETEERISILLLLVSSIPEEQENVAKMYWNAYISSTITPP